MELLGAATGGAEVSIASPNQLEGVARSVADEIAQYYLIQIALREPLVKDSSLQIGAINSTRQKRKDVELTFLEKLSACAESAAAVKGGGPRD